jgi:hypothetical protein
MILDPEERVHQPLLTQPCPGSGERQEWRGGKGHDVHMGMTYDVRERVLFIGTQFSILYTSMYSPAEAATLRVPNPNRYMTLS